MQPILPLAPTDLFRFLGIFPRDARFVDIALPYLSQLVSPRVRTNPMDIFFLFSLVAHQINFTDNVLFYRTFYRHVSCVHASRSALIVLNVVLCATKRHLEIKIERVVCCHKFCSTSNHVLRNCFFL